MNSDETFAKAEELVAMMASIELPWYFARVAWLMTLAELLAPILVIGFADKTHSLSNDELYSYTFSDNLVDLYAVGGLLLISVAVFTRYMCIPFVACISLALMYGLVVAKGILYKHFNDPILIFAFAWITFCVSVPQLLVIGFWFFDGYDTQSFHDNDADHDYLLMESEEGEMVNATANSAMYEKDVNRGKRSIPLTSRSSKFYGYAHMRERQARRRLEKDDEEKKHSSVGRLLGWAKAEWRMMSIATVALVISSFANLIQPMYFGKIIQLCSDSDPNRKELNNIVYILLVVFAIGGVASTLRGYCYGLIGERVVRNIRKELFSAIVGQDISFFDTNKTGELTNRLSSDTAVIQSTLSLNVSMGLRAVGAIIVSLVLLFITSWELTFIMLAVVPPLIIIATAYGRFTRQYTKDYQDALAAAADVGNETISNIRIVRSYGAEELERKRYQDNIQVSYQKGKVKAAASGLFVGGMGMLANLAILCVIYFGAIMVSQGKLAVGELTSFIIYSIYIALSFGEISSLFTDFMNALGASERIFRILDTIPAIPTRGGLWPAQAGDGKAIRVADYAGDGKAPFHSSVYAKLISHENRNLTTDSSAVWTEHLSPAKKSFGDVKIHIEKVRFNYPTRSDVEVLKGFDLSIRENQMVALVGSSGSGKSTVLALLQRFYDVNPGGGCIKIDGTDIRTLDPLFLRRNMGIVPQEPVLFSGSIRSNIMYSRLAAEPVLSEADYESVATTEEVEWAGKKANAHEFISSFPEGYDTVVGERGVRLSGGQKQRIAIARALLMNPKILLLDEATSALDSESEHLVQDAINQLMINRTTIVIAHRLSTVRDADVIAMCGKGRVLAAGTHTELMENCEPYKNLVKRQLQIGDGASANLNNSVGSGLGALGSSQASLT